MTGGFLYIHPPTGQELLEFLSSSRLYIPDIIREDTHTQMIFFEIDLKPATQKLPGPQR
jgi:hypothetical protein